jgi:hypothetical protein
MPFIPDTPKRIWHDPFCKAEMDLYSHQAPKCPHQACELAVWGRIKQPKTHTYSLYVCSRLCEPFTSKEKAKNGLFKLVVDTTPAHCTVFLQYRVMWFMQGLILPPQPKHGYTTTYVCCFWGVSSDQTLLIVAESCKMTCFARIMTPSSSHKKLEAVWNSRFWTAYDRYSHGYQLTLIFALELCLEMKMERLEQSPCEWGSHGGAMW